jgi:hypothetical protein
MEVDLILCDIITKELGIDPSLVVVKDDDFVAPTDPTLLYATVGLQRTKILSSKVEYDYGEEGDTTASEIKSVCFYKTLIIELNSKNRDALERQEEIIMSLTSYYSQNQQALNQIRIFRGPDIINISSTVGPFTLKKYQIPVIITGTKTKTTPLIPIYDKFKPVEVTANE